ncbi:MAG: PAS domain S-box protein [Rhodospirillales bacterium]|nr:PAS domain S-box protein [Rhodospirillales bacterium]
MVRIAKWQGMLHPFHKRLSFSLARIGVTVAFLLGVSIGVIQVALDYSSQEEILDATIQRILEVTARTATPAALNLDEKLATEIVAGLLDYEFIVRARIDTDLGDALAAVEIARKESETRWITRQITSEFSEFTISLYDAGNPSVEYGTLFIVVDRDAALTGFFDRSIFIFSSGVARSFLLVLFLFGIFYWRLSKPLVTLVEGLGQIDPNKPGASRLPIPVGHENDELGVLADTANRYLETSQILLAERERAEKLLRESEQRLQAVLDNTPVCMNLKDIEGRYLLVNKTFEEWLGHSAEDLLGKTSAETINDPTEVADVTDAERRVLETGKPFEKEISVRREEKTYHLILIKYPVASADGSINAIGTVAVDITDRKKAEQSLKQYAIIWEQMSEAVLVLDAEGRIIDWNPGAERVFGYTKEEVVGKFSDMLIEEDAPGARRVEIGEVLKTEGHYTGQTPFVRKDGYEGVVEAHIMPLYDIDGKIVGRIGVNRDITERLKTEERLRHAQKMEAVGQLTGGVAHDFNNLLQIVQSHLEILKLDVDVSETTLDHVETALKAGRRGGQLTQQLLAFSRKQTLHPQTVAPNNLIEGMLSLLGRTLGDHIEIETDLGENIPSITIDSNGFENAILNLAVNARSAMTGGGKLIVASSAVRLEKERISEDGSLPIGQYVEITVTDTGSGMAPDILKHAFEPFFTTKDVGEGSGLGLSMVYGFIRQSGGHVSLESTPEKGTTARILLPAAFENAAVEANVSPVSTVTNKATFGTILVVEDDPDVRLSAVMVLNSYGFDTREAEDGAAALEVLDQDDGIDLLFSDVMMPKGMNGLDLAREASRRHRGLKVLLTSGYPEAELAKSGLLKSGFTLLGKPYTNGQLSDALAVLLPIKPE